MAATQNLHLALTMVVRVMNFLSQVCEILYEIYGEETYKLSLPGLHVACLLTSFFCSHYCSFQGFESLLYCGGLIAFKFHTSRQQCIKLGRKEISCTFFKMLKIIPNVYCGLFYSILYVYYKEIWTYSIIILMGPSANLS